ncbi:hypothetical protein QDR37_08715 [Amnibacterium sp. CER49]|uniref:hypothetical protein n=1 Tax=Amnibacterium sp. CER49 TaxID=3039161 RepID=UPI0024486783|nr:hypothetical protein [Amnibacterium sp. CER49]MDH2444024.1 hypothetical protein [Amnibacterium sp. CER49]
MTGARRGGIDLVRAAIGVVDLVAAPAVAPLELGHRADDVTVTAYRVLGARQVVQALLTRATGGPRAHRLAGVVDVLHAGSMVLLALLDPPRRRAAVIQCVVASTFAAAELAAAWSEDA